MRADLGSRSLTVGLVLASLVLGVVGVGFGQIPRMINYQGRLVDATGAPLAGSHTVVFRIFGDVVGGAQLWTETQSVTADSAGIFGAILGAVDPIDVDFDSPRWLEVEVDGQVLAPRREMTSVPFAFQAANSHMLQGLDADAFADSAHSHHSLDAADGSPTGVVYVDDAGNVGVGTQTPEAQLDVAGTARTSGFEMPTGAATGRVLTSDANGTGTWQAPAAVPDADWVIAGDNMYSGVPGKVGIGNTSPYARFDVKDTSSTSNVVAIYGRATSSNAQGSKGVLGETYSTADVYFGIGVGGLSNGTQGSGVGVSGASYGPTGKGVEGTAVSNSGVNYGVYGRTYSPDGYAGYFIGDRSYFNGHVGVGVMDPQCPIDAVTSSQTSSAKAIRGVATGGYTEGQQVSGVYGRTESAATTNPGAGVFGAASASTGGSAGVRGESAGQTGKGLFGWATHTSGKNYGVYGETMSSNGYAGYFLGGRNYFEGRVGIGIDNPQEQLHVDGGASTVTVQLTNDTSGATASDGLHLLLSPLGDGRLINDEARNLDLGTAGVPRLSIFPSGKIGIGGYDT
ncbi:MAG TPA: hypothetical protein VMU02_06590, partial [bacterium]|nr:hypothetical protein [bacterium]